MGIIDLCDFSGSPVRFIRELKHRQGLFSTLAALTGVTESVICDVFYGRLWRYDN
jgi:hypothetical protein